MYVFILPSSALQELEAKQYTQHLQLNNNNKMEARQYTQYLQLHKKWEPDNTHSIFSLTNTKNKKEEERNVRQYTQHLQVHKKEKKKEKGARQYTHHLQHHKTWEPDNTHSIFSFTITGN